MNEKHLTDLLILHLAKKMTEKMEKIKNGFHHHEVLCTAGFSLKK